MLQVENRFEVPRRQWAKWSDQARSVFNDTYQVMMENQRLFLHPKAKAQEAEHWKTTCWNAAWSAAEAVREYAKAH